MSTRWKFSGAAALLVVVMVLAACGGGDESSATGGSKTSASGASPVARYVESMGDECMGPATSEAIQALVDKGQTAGDEAGRVALPKVKVGYLQIVGAVESARKAEEVYNCAFKSLGWDVVRCDAQGDTTKMARCGDSLLNQGVDVIFNTGIEPVLLKAQLAKAKQKGVPVIESNAPVADGGYDGAYYMDNARAGEMVGKFMLEKLRSVDGAKKIAFHTFPATFATQRTDKVKKMVEGQSDIAVIKDFVNEGTDLVGGDARATTTQLNQHPDLKAIVVGFDAPVVGTAQAVNQKFRGKQFPEKPLVLGFSALGGSREWIKRGVIDAASDVTFSRFAWVAVDQAAEYFARKTPFAKEPIPKYPINYVDYQLITKDNLPPDGEDPHGGDEAAPFFVAKWAAEFEGVPAAGS